MPERVAITGIGVVTPVGIGLDAFSRSLRAGTSGVRRIDTFDCTDFDTQIAAGVADDFDGTAWVAPPKMAKLMSRSALFAVAAAAMARQAAGLGAEDSDPERTGVVLGAAGMGPTDNDLLATQARAMLESAQSANGDWNVPAFARVFCRRTNPLATLRGLPNLAAAHVAIQQDARGPNSTITTACTAGTQAIGEGLRLIQRGDADVVFAGGADATINPVTVLGFSLLGTLSRRNHQPNAASRPFDLERDGFVIGEGAGVVVLERESLARSRGAPVLAELAGYGVTCDAYRITDERPDAAGAARAIRLCLRDADAEPGDVDYINAHGTGTRMNDLTETRAIKEALGPKSGETAVSSTKSMMGHLLAAAGAVEVAAVVAGMCGNFLPPTINLDTPDPECDLDYVAGSARAGRVDAALTNSFGFGGQNACLLIRRW
jgi:3-oxoacyl-[acyl-carrier-protein] synthase II